MRGRVYKVKNFRTTQTKGIDERIKLCRALSNRHRLRIIATRSA